MAGVDVGGREGGGGAPGGLGAIFGALHILINDINAMYKHVNALIYLIYPNPPSEILNPPLFWPYFSCCWVQESIGFIGYYFSLVISNKEEPLISFY